MVEVPEDSGHAGPGFSQGLTFTGEMVGTLGSSERENLSRQYVSPKLGHNVLKIRCAPLLQNTDTFLRDESNRNELSNGGLRSLEQHHQKRITGVFLAVLASLHLVDGIGSNKNS